MRGSSVLRALAVIGILGGLTGATPVPAAASLRVDIGIFAHDLAPHGRWIVVRDHGDVWVPRVRAGWRPYTIGRWVWTDDYGWMWVSDEPFGWAVYHYGRWYLDPVLGWVWVPGRQWAPAWVTFRHGGGYVGWAPLPPRFRWDARIGFRVGAVDFDAWIRPHHYCFVPERRFLDDRIYRRAMPAPANVTIVNVTRNVTSYTMVRDRVVNRSLAVATMERATGRAVPRMRVARVDSARAGERVRNRDVRVFRPRDDDDDRAVESRRGTREAERARKDRERARDEDRGRRGKGWRDDHPSHGKPVAHGRDRQQSEARDVNSRKASDRGGKGTERRRDTRGPDRHARADRHQGGRNVAVDHGRGLRQRDHARVVRSTADAGRHAGRAKLRAHIPGGREARADRSAGKASRQESRGKGRSEGRGRDRDARRSGRDR